jgi:hypothetical protein
MQQQWRRWRTRKDRMKLNLPPKLVEKLELVWVPVISSCKIFILSYAFWCPIMPKLAVLTPRSCDFTDNYSVQKETQFWLRWVARTLVPNRALLIRVGVFQKKQNTCTGHFGLFEVLSHLWRIDSAWLSAFQIHWTISTDALPECKHQGPIVSN